MEFLDPILSSNSGLVAIGGDLNVATLTEAYRKGIFPWPSDMLPMAWYCPEERGILEFSELNIPRSMAKEVARSSFTCTIDRDFDRVIRYCSEILREDDTWINRRMIAAYNELHAAGYAHSVETWEGDTLVGGLYGVSVDGTFAGESMFHSRPGASKQALLHLIDHLRARGVEWIDIQVLSPLMQMLGARNITRDEFLAKLAETRARGLQAF